MSRFDCTGITAIETVGAVLALNPDIVEVSVFEPREAPLAQERLADDANTQTIVQSGLQLRQQIGLPFWDAVLLSCFGAGATALPILKQALFHNSSPRRRVLIPSGMWSAAYLLDLSRASAPGGILAMSSRVRLGGGAHGHIPMLDYHCPPSSANEDLCVRVASLVDGGGGYLLASGQSYHYYGKSLVPEPDLPAFLGRALLFSPIIDRAWVAHQIIEGACGLRISPKGNGNPTPPRVVAEVPPSVSSC